MVRTPPGVPGIASRTTTAPESSLPVKILDHRPPHDGCARCYGSHQGKQQGAGHLASLQDQVDRPVLPFLQRDGGRVRAAGRRWVEGRD